MTVLVEILHVLTISPTHKVCVRLSDTETKACIVGHVMVGATLLITSLKPDNGLDKSCWKNNIETFKHQSTNCSLAFMKPFRSLLQFNEYKYNAWAKLFCTLTQPLHYINRCPVNHSNVQLRTFFFPSVAKSWRTSMSGGWELLGSDIFSEQCMLFEWKIWKDFSVQLPTSEQPMKWHPWEEYKKKEGRKAWTVPNTQKNSCHVI